MNTEKTLLSIISDLTTDKILQDKVIALYQDHKKETSNLRHYAWFLEPNKETPVYSYTYTQFYDLFLTAYSDAIKSTRKDVSDDTNILHLDEGVYITHDYGDGYECFFTYGKIAVEKEGDATLNLRLPSFGWDLPDDKVEVEYLSKKNLIQKELDDIHNVDGGVAYRTISEWEDIFFNAPYYPTVVQEVDLLEGGGLTEDQEYRLSQIDDGFKRIKSLDQLSKEMPYLLTKCYELLIKIRG